MSDYSKEIKNSSSKSQIHIINNLPEKIYHTNDDSISKIYFDYELNTVLSLRKSGTVDIFKNYKLIFSKNDGEYS